MDPMSYALAKNDTKAISRSWMLNAMSYHVIAFKQTLRNSSPPLTLYLHWQRGTYFNPPLCLVARHHARRRHGIPRIGWSWILPEPAAARAHWARLSQR
jgi:hypothetical protein